MPLYVAGTAPALYPGDSITLVSAEVLTAPANSMAFVKAYGPGSSLTLEFQTIFASAPTASLLVQGSNLDVDADYETLFTSTNTQFDKYPDLTAFVFYRVRLASQSAGGALTVVVAYK